MRGHGICFGGDFGEIIHFGLETLLGVYANGANQVQMLQNTASDQHLHCLLPGISMQHSENEITYQKLLN